MTEEDFAKKRFRHSEEIIYTCPYRKVETPCMLMAVDFIEGVMKLIPFDTENYADEPFTARIENCKRPYHKLKKVK